jgi:hypothetical protein
MFVDTEKDLGHPRSHSDFDFDLFGGEKILTNLPKFALQPSSL